MTPRELVGVTDRVRAELDARHCLIPIAEAKAAGRPAVMRGAFYRAEDRDWAVICSRPAEGKTRQSTLFVLGKMRDFQADSVGGTLYDRPFPLFSQQDSARTYHALDWRVSAASVAVMKDVIRACVAETSDCPDRGERGPRVHEGLLQGESSDGATTIFYWTGRRWIELPGGD